MRNFGRQNKAAAQFFVHDISQSASIELRIFQESNFFKSSVTSVTSRFFQNSARFPFGNVDNVLRNAILRSYNLLVMNFALWIVNSIRLLERLPQNLRIFQTLTGVRFGPNRRSFSVIISHHVVMS